MDQECWPSGNQGILGRALSPGYASGCTRLKVIPQDDSPSRGSLHEGIAIVRHVAPRHLRRPRPRKDLISRGNMVEASRGHLLPEDTAQMIPKCKSPHKKGKGALPFLRVQATQGQEDHHGARRVSRSQVADDYHQDCFTLAEAGRFSQDKSRACPHDNWPHVATLATKLWGKRTKGTI